MLTTRIRRGTALIAGLLAAGGTVAALAATPAFATPSTGVVLSEVYGGGGNSGATYTNDFIELANRAAGPQSVDGWSVQYLNAGATTNWQVTNLSGSVGASGNYLVGEAAGTGGTQALPAPQATGSIAIAGTGGTVALVHATDALTCKTAADCAADNRIVDLVGWGPSTVVREGTPAPATTNTTSVNRTGAPDTDDNSVDFVTAAPSPAAPPTTPRIHDIQSDHWVSPSDGATVSGVPGIVTGERTSGSSRGYWIQDPDPDSDPATSEGIFVFTGSTAPTVAVGDAVTVSGTVSEYYPGSDASVLSATEIGHPSATVLSSGNPLPAPIVLTPSTVPSQYAPDLGGGNIESTPITPSRSALDFYESIEGMRVEVDNARVVGPSNSFGEQYVTTKPNQARTYRGGTELTAENATPSGRLEVVPADGSNPHVNVGDVFGGATVGPIDYSSFGGYVLIATTLGAVDPANLPRTVATGPGRGKLSIATYNVENLAPTDDPAKFARLGEGVVTNLASPDIVAVEEVQDNDGATDHGGVAADQTLTALTDAIRTAGGPSYQWREIDPVNDQDGGEPGGNIRVVFLFNPARVSFIDAGSPSVDRSTTATSVVNSGGAPALTLSPGRIDPTNPVWTDSRKPLVGQFRFGGKDVFVVANHFDSKGGDESADGRYQYPQRSSEVQRAGQAAAVHDFVASILAVRKKADVVVVGDLNDYQFSPALKVLTTGTAAGTAAPILSDLITTLPLDQQYTYVFNGVSQVLDHILVSSSVGGVDYQVVHLNAEYSDQTSDHDPQVVDIKP